MDVGKDAADDGGNLEPIVIKAPFIMRQIKSMADKSVNVTVNLPEGCAEQAAELLKHIDGYGEIALVFLAENSTNGGTTGRNLQADK